MKDILSVEDLRNLFRLTFPNQRLPLLNKWKYYENQVAKPIADDLNNIKWKVIKAIVKISHLLYLFFLASPIFIEIGISDRKHKIDRKCKIKSIIPSVSLENSIMGYTGGFPKRSSNIGDLPKVITPLIIFVKINA